MAKTKKGQGNVVIADLLLQKYKLAKIFFCTLHF